MTEEQKEKQRARWRKYYHAHPERSKARRVKSQQSNSEYVDSFKTSCSACGIDDKRVLDFHHVDPETKAKGVATLRVAGYAKSKIKAEIDKCILLCANCHRIEHWEETHVHE